MPEHLGLRVGILSSLAALTLLACGEEKPKPSQVSPAEQVAFVSSDSVHLAGTWQYVQNSRAVVICIPTVGFTRSSWSNTMRLLANAGWSALSFDLRGQGDSRLPVGSTWKWSPRDSAGAIEHYVRDIRAAVRYVRAATNGNVRIILLGADISGVAALYAATAEPQLVAGVALVTPPGGLDKLIAARLVDRYGDRPLMIMTEQPISGTAGTPRTLDSWLEGGRGSAITLRLTAPQETTALENRQAALNKLMRWIDSATL